MSADLAAVEKLLPRAIKHFWKARKRAAKKQKTRGASDRGNRASVTAGKNMDGFVRLVHRLVADNGVPNADVFTRGRPKLTIPGFYRPTKNWDLLVVSGKCLLAAVEFKSMVGSFGNNFNNRVEEALGNATDLLTAYREGVFGESQKPFLGYVFVLEDCPKALSPVRLTSPHFAALPEFENTSYAARYEILCRKLVHENLYDAATLLLTSRSDERTGKCHSLSEMTSIRRFAASLAGRIAAVAAE